MQKRKKMSKSRLGYLVLAGLLVIAIIVSGTLAYTNYQQTALNRFEGYVNHGVRLHDDYAIKVMEKDNDKDVYVENYGTSQLLVRVRLDEFFQIGQGVLGAAGSNAVSPIGNLDNSTYNDPRYGWNPIAWDTAITTNGSGVTSAVMGDGMWKWIFGGDKFYLPTENIYDENNDPDNAYSRGNLLPFTEDYPSLNKVQQPDPGNFFYDRLNDSIANPVRVNPDGVRKYYAWASAVVDDGWFGDGYKETSLGSGVFTWQGTKFAAGTGGLPLHTIAKNGLLGSPGYAAGDVWTNNVFPTFKAPHTELPPGFDPGNEATWKFVDAETSEETPFDPYPFYAKTVQQTKSYGNTVLTQAQWEAGGYSYSYMYTNASLNAVTIGGTTIEPGETELVTVAVPADTKVSGPFWMLAEDGWFYWMELLQPGEATGLLLTEVNRLFTPADDYFYGINVILQASNLAEVDLLGTYNDTTFGDLEEIVDGEDITYKVDNGSANRAPDFSEDVLKIIAPQLFVEPDDGDDG